MRSNKSQLYFQITSQLFEHIKWECNNYLFISQSFCSHGAWKQAQTDFWYLILLSNCLVVICKTKRVLRVSDTCVLFPHSALFFYLSHVRASTKPFFLDYVKERLFVTLLESVNKILRCYHSNGFLWQNVCIVLFILLDFTKRTWPFLWTFFGGIL